MPRVRVIKSIKPVKKEKEDDKYEIVKGIKMRKDRITNYILLNNKNEEIKKNE